MLVELNCMERIKIMANRTSNRAIRRTLLAGRAGKFRFSNRLAVIFHIDGFQAVTWKDSIASQNRADKRRMTTL
jgi:hypothetical protein